MFRKSLLPRAVLLGDSGTAKRWALVGRGSLNHWRCALLWHAFQVFPSPHDEVGNLDLLHAPTVTGCLTTAPKQCNKMSQTGTSKIMTPYVLFLFINWFSRLIISALILKGHQRWYESKLRLAHKPSHYLFLPQRSYSAETGFELATLARVTLDLGFSYTQTVGLQACTITPNSCGVWDQARGCVYTW